MLDTAYFISASGFFCAGYYPGKKQEKLSSFY